MSAVCMCVWYARVWWIWAAVTFPLWDRLSVVQEGTEYCVTMFIQTSANTSPSDTKK